MVTPVDLLFHDVGLDTARYRRDVTIANCGIGHDLVKQEVTPSVACEAKDSDWFGANPNFASDQLYWCHQLG